MISGGGGGDVDQTYSSALELQLERQGETFS
jgi:hypothetical protein